MKDNLAQRIEQIAVELTEQLSVVDTPDELKMAQLVYDIFMRMDYFKQHPQNLKMVTAQDDKMKRNSVMAIVNGQKNPSNKDTVLLIGHTDTVGISDYADLMHLANKPYELTEKLKEIADKLPEDTRQDLQSGEYLFGRGLFDMKAGDAVLIALIEQITADIENFDGNLIFLGVCDEESGSCGMLACTTELVALQKQHDYNYLALLDTDYMTAEYVGDDKKYIYVGTVGKLMPAFYVVGKETHVGESFKGIDPNQIAAAITTEINLNPDYCDIAEGEVTLPPITLRQRDLKPEYSVQVAQSANLFFNYATHCSTPDQVLEKVRKGADKAFSATIELLQQRFDRFNEMSSRPKQTLPWKSRVMSYTELYSAVKAEMGEALDKAISELVSKMDSDESLDSRDRALKIVELVQASWSDRDPVVVVYFTPPYYPHIYIEGTSEKDKRLLNAVSKTVDSTDTGYNIVYKKFFPYISDLSYAAAPKDPKTISALKDNMPGFGEIYKLPIEDMQALSLPVLDIGTFGKDAHKFTERLHKEYSFKVTPELVYKTIMNLLIGE